MIGQECSPLVVWHIHWHFGGLYGGRPNLKIFVIIINSLQQEKYIFFTWLVLTCKHCMEIRATWCQHHFVALYFLGPHVQHYVTQKPPLAHSVHADEGIMVVPLWIVGDAVALPGQKLHRPFHGWGLVSWFLLHWLHTLKLYNKKTKHCITSVYWHLLDTFTSN